MKDRFSVTEFKATCLKIIETVRTTGRSITITKNGEPAVTVIPVPAISSKKKRRFGAMRDEVLYVADIVSPLGEEEWEVLK